MIPELKIRRAEIQSENIKAVVGMLKDVSITLIQQPATGMVLAAGLTEIARQRRWVNDATAGMLTGVIIAGGTITAISNMIPFAGGANSLQKLLTAGK